VTVARKSLILRSGTLIAHSAHPGGVPMERTEHEAVLPRPASSPARILYVVARDRLDLYTALLEAFVESPRLGIMLDRRDAPGAHRGPGDRRRLRLDEVLRTRGWARVRIEPDGRAILLDQ
jgi:hypothetical protein